MRKRVLMIDDDPDIREVASLSLETMVGWEMLQAGTASDGVTKAEQEHPDIILLDLMMPDVDGRATLSRLKSNPKTADIPVILLTAKTQASDLEDLKGLAGMLAKPFDPLTLGEEIARTMGWSNE